MILKSKVLEAEFLTLAALFWARPCKLLPLPNEDGTRSVLCVNLCSNGTRSLVTSVEHGSGVVSTEDLKGIFDDIEDDSGDIDIIFDSAENTLVSAENQSHDAETFRDAEKR